MAAATEERDVRALRVAWSVDMGFAPVNRDVRRAFAAALDILSNLGCRLTEAHPLTTNPMAMWTFSRAARATRPRDRSWRHGSRR